MDLKLEFKFFDDFNGRELYYTKLSIVNWNISNAIRYLLGKPMFFSAVLPREEYVWDRLTPYVESDDVFYSRVEHLLCDCSDPYHYLRVTDYERDNLNSESLDLVMPVEHLSLLNRIKIVLGHLFLDDFDPVFGHFVDFILPKSAINKFINTPIYGIV